jgi:hypothetical protein
MYLSLTFAPTSLATLGQSTWGSTQQTIKAPSLSQIGVAFRPRASTCAMATLAHARASPLA